MTSYTPGPWRANGGLIETANGIALEIATCSPDDRIGSATRHRDSRLANARLIAAAPTLLEALQDAEFLLRKLAINPKEALAMRDSLNRSAESARVAIAKAEGKV